MIVLNGGVGAMDLKEFLSLYDDVVPLTDELYQCLIDSGEFPNMTRKKV